MHADLANIGWTEEQWNRIVIAATEEAQKARVVAQMLPLSGPESPETVAIPNYTLFDEPAVPAVPAPRRLAVDSDPTLYLTRVAINVALRTREAADPNLSAALAMFRRAANYIARIEDALVLNGRPPNAPPWFGLAGIPPIYQVTGDGWPLGIFTAAPSLVPVAAPTGAALVAAIVTAINTLEAAGQLGPFACVLSNTLYEWAHDPTAAMVLPRDRILPMLQGGPILRSSTIFDGTFLGVPWLGTWGAVVATSGSPVEIVVASDIHVRFLQTSAEPRLVFRVSERCAVRIRENQAIVLLRF